MKKFFLIIFFILLSSVISIVILLLYLVRNLDANKLVKVFSDELKAKTGFYLDFKSASFDVRKGLEIERVILKDRNEKEFCRARKVILIYDPSVLLTERKLKINAITFEKALSGVKEIELFLDKFLNREIKPSKKNLISVEVSRIYIKDSILRYKDRLLEVSGGISFYKEKPPYLDLNFSYKDSKLSYRGDFNLANVTLRNLLPSMWLEIQLPIYVMEAKFVLSRKDSMFHFNFSKFKGKYLNKEFEVSKEFKIGYNAKSNTVDLEELELNLVNDRLILRKGKYENISNFSIIIENGKINISNYLNGIEGEVSGNLAISANGKYISLNGEINLSGVNLGEFRNISAKLSIYNNSLSLNGDGKLFDSPINFSLSSRNIFEKSFDLVLNASELLLTNILTFFNPTSNSSLKIADYLTNLNYKIKVDEIRIENYKIENFEVIGKINPQKIIIDSLYGILFGGKLKSYGLLEKDLLSLNVVYRNGRMDEFSKIILKDDKKLYGILSLDADLSMKVFNLSTLTAKITGKINNGEFQNVFILKDLKEFLFDIPLDHIYFDNLTFDLDLKSLNLLFNSVELKSSKIFSSLKGNYSLDKNVLSLDIFLSFAKDYLEGLPNIAQILLKGKQNSGRVDFKIYASGDKNNFRFNLID